LADLQRTVYPHSGHPSSEGRAQDSSPAKDRRSANCATQPTNGVIAAYCSNFGQFAFLSHPLWGVGTIVRCSS